MKCEYNNCTNTGATNCPICSKVVCDMHLKNSTYRKSRCISCYLADKRKQLLFGGFIVCVAGVLAFFQGGSLGIFTGIFVVVCGIIALIRGFTGRTGLFFTKNP